MVSVGIESRRRPLYHSPPRQGPYRPLPQQHVSHRIKLMKLKIADAEKAAAFIYIRGL